MTELDRAVALAELEAASVAVNVFCRETLALDIVLGSRAWFERDKRLAPLWARQSKAVEAAVEAGLNPYAGNDGI